MWAIAWAISRMLSRLRLRHLLSLPRRNLLSVCDTGLLQNARIVTLSHASQRWR